MDYRKMGKTGFMPSALGFGTMRLPCVNGRNSGADVDLKESGRMIRYAIDNGVNYIDTAYPYHDGQSEVAVGEALKGGYREKVAVADKSPVFYIKNETDFDKFLDTQLKRLNTDHIDYYLLHSLSEKSFQNIVLKFNVIEKLERAKKAGKVGHIGFSFHDSFRVFETIINAFDGWEFCQIQLNYLDTQKQAGLKGLQYAASKGLGVAIMEPMLGGKLAAPPPKVMDIFSKSANTRSPVEWALDFLWNMPEVSVVLSGMSTFEQVCDNVAYASKNLFQFSEEDEKIMREVKKKFEELTGVPCTGCAYCMPCPNGVNIPRNFSVYNDLFLYEDKNIGFEAMRQLEKWEGEKARALYCKSCKACEKHCPQKINISEKMADVTKAFNMQ